MTISTVITSVGNIVCYQSFGFIHLYNGPRKMGFMAALAILVGGASINRATNTQAIVGCLLFHTLFVVAQDAGTALFGDPAIGEFFRVFLCYGVIALALVMYAWKGSDKRVQTPTLAGSKR